MAVHAIISGNASAIASLLRSLKPSIETIDVGGSIFFEHMRKLVKAVRKLVLIRFTSASVPALVTSALILAADSNWRIALVEENKPVAPLSISAMTVHVRKEGHTVNQRGVNLLLIIMHAPSAREIFKILVLKLCGTFGAAEILSERHTRHSRIELLTLFTFDAVKTLESYKANPCMRLIKTIRYVLYSDHIQ